MATIFTYVSNQTFPLTYKVFTGNAQIGVLTQELTLLLGSGILINFSFRHYQSDAKIEFSMPYDETKKEPLLAFEKQLARIAGAIYPPLMAHLSNP